MTDVRVDGDLGIDGDLEIGDDELAALALAADPDAEVGEDAVPLVDASGTPLGALPGWYMPPAMASNRLLTGWRRRIVLLIVASFVLINAYGLCSTYGHVAFG
jgi:hypothetical protein